MARPYGLGYWPMLTQHGERVCVECGDVFVAKAPGQRYCKPAHEVANRNRRHQAKSKRKARKAK